jgi:uncharacterized membrane protein required for colicin V production
MTSADILLALVIAGCFLVGFFWGVIRGLLALAAWFVVFVLAAHLSQSIGDYLARQWTQFSPAWDHMAAFLIGFSVLYAIALVLIHFGVRGPTTLSRYPLVDDVLGGLLGASVGLLMVAAVISILETFYGPNSGVGGVGADWSRAAYVGLIDSTLGNQVQASLVPALASLLGALLPAQIRGAL